MIDEGRIVVAQYGVGSSRRSRSLSKRFRSLTGTSSSGPISQSGRSRPPSRFNVTSCGLPAARASCQNWPARSNAAPPPGTAVETGSAASEPAVFVAFDQPRLGLLRRFDEAGLQRSPGRRCCTRSGGVIGWFAFTSRVTLPELAFTVASGSTPTRLSVHLHADGEDRARGTADEAGADGAPERALLRRGDVDARATSCRYSSGSYCRCSTGTARSAISGDPSAATGGSGGGRSSLAQPIGDAASMVTST